MLDSVSPAAPTPLADSPMSDSDASSQNENLPWYDPEPEIGPLARDLFENYSGIPPEDVEEHVLTMRDKMWEVFPYPCIGECGWLDFNVAERNSYPYIVGRMRGKPWLRHLDIGTGVGQDIRKLVHDGVPSRQIVGIELHQGFIDLGYALFKDKDKLQTRFVSADMLDPNNEELKSLDGKFETIHLGLVLQLFTFEEQIQFLINTIAKLRPGGGGLICGHFLGHKDGIEVPDAFERPNFRHNWRTFLTLWEEIERRTQRTYSVRGTVDNNVGFGRNRGMPSWRDPDSRRIVFDIWTESTPHRTIGDLGSATTHE